MDDNTLQRVRLTLTNYLEENKCRKTPERYAILEAIYDMEGHFTLEELSAKMEQQAFRVSRATLYNAIHLFIKLRLVVRHNFQQGTRYEASFQNDNHCHEVCTICGQVKEVQAAQVAQAVEKMRRQKTLKRKQKIIPRNEQRKS